MSMFVTTRKHLADSVTRFMAAPEYWREAVGGMPKYFVHVRCGDKHQFGLSKFVAFKNIDLGDYVREYRHDTHGGITQKHISRVMGLTWTPLHQVSPTIRKAFIEWFFGFFPDHYNQRHISCISLGDVAAGDPGPRKISPEDLARKLREQVETGRLGEKVALEYEKARVRLLGVDKPEKWVIHVAAQNSAAGFDIWSHPPRKETRYIEVKASKGGHGVIYLTRHEVETLRKHKDEAFLYLVAIEGAKGRVVKEIQDPIRHIESTSRLEPIAYRAQIET